MLIHMLEADNIKEDRCIYYLRSFVWERVEGFPDVCLFVCLIHTPNRRNAGSNYFGVPPPSYVYLHRSPFLSSSSSSYQPLFGLFTGGYFTSASVPLLSMFHICLIHVYPVRILRPCLCRCASFMGLLIGLGFCPYGLLANY